MSDSRTTELEARRRFLKQVGAAAVTVPAAALLLSAASRPTLAQSRYGGDWGGTTRSVETYDSYTPHQKVVPSFKP